jgi:hypothetical protein
MLIDQVILPYDKLAWRTGGVAAVIDASPRRLLAIGLLAVGLLVSGSAYATLQPAPGLGAPPDGTDLTEDAAAYVGQEVVVGGTVVIADPLTIEVTGGTGERARFRVAGVDRELRAGDRLYVQGVLESAGEIAVTAVVYTPTADFRRTFLLSALAALWVLGRGLRHWRPDWRRLVLRRRTGGVAASARRGNEPGTDESNEAGS